MSRNTNQFLTPCLIELNPFCIEIVKMQARRNTCGFVDKTGTIDTSALALCNLRKTEQQEIREINSIQVPDELLRVHGMAPPTKAEGSVCLIYENVNGFQNKMCGNEKVDKAKDLHNELKVNIAAYCKHWLNM